MCIWNFESEFHSESLSRRPAFGVGRGARFEETSVSFEEKANTRDLVTLTPKIRIYSGPMMIV